MRLQYLCVYTHGAVNHLEEANPSQWWICVPSTIGMDFRSCASEIHNIILYRRLGTGISLDETKELFQFLQLYLTTQDAPCCN